MHFKIPTDTLTELLGVASPDFPKYTTQILNLANQNAQGTRPSVVGQMSDLIVKAEATSVEEWEAWYQKKYPNGIQTAADRVEAMVELFRLAIGKIDRPLIDAWVHDLVINKTYIGFGVQQTVLLQLASRLGVELQPATPEDESRGIDGYLGTQPVQIKPASYKSKDTLPESIMIPIVYYEKTSTGVSVDATELSQVWGRGH